MSTDSMSSDWSPRLPFELVTEIFRWVEVPYRELALNENIERPNRYSDPLNPYLISRKTLRHICLASRSFNAVARRFLYRNVMLLHATDIVLLFRTLLEEGGPNRKSRVQYGLRSNIENLACLVTLFDEAAMRETAQAWRLLSLPKHVEPFDMTVLYVSQLRLGRILDEQLEDFFATPQLLLGGLLGLTTRLSSITLQCPMGVSDTGVYTPLDTVIRSLRRHPQVGQNILTHLSTLAVHPESGYGTSGRIRHRQTLFSSLLELPTLKTLLARCCIGPPRAAEGDGARGLSLERVALHGSCSLEADVESYAALCQNLRYLEIYATADDAVAIDTARLPGADRLESLILRLMPGDAHRNNPAATTAAAAAAVDHSAESDSDGGRVTSLRSNFTRLASLTIEDRLLFRDATHMESIGLAARLPRSLVSLVLVEQWNPPSSALHHDQDGHLGAVTRALFDAAGECPEHLPSLRNVVLDRSQPRVWQGAAAHDALQTRYHDLKVAFAAVSVEFVVRELSHHASNA
ncbi:hypothetical protein DL762_002819 [Monosporascus cannonballus]|uniref:F-box domain-containing protein n=1 Tax=Monosporascus cannonballus TaxID=155416 RepID=A0ABY0HDP2_9PEZI|nr:hypothetical protein DL762_002819 [Monosporascus cannonballus]